MQRSTEISTSELSQKYIESSRNCRLDNGAYRLAKDGLLTLNFGALEGVNRASLYFNNISGDGRIRASNGGQNINIRIASKRSQSIDINLNGDKRVRLNRSGVGEVRFLKAIIHQEDSMAHNWQSILSKCTHHRGVKINKGRAFAASGAIVRADKIVKVSTCPDNMYQHVGSEVKFLGACEVTNLVVEGNSGIKPAAFPSFNIDPNIVGVVKFNPYVRKSATYVLPHKSDAYSVTIVVDSVNARTKLSITTIPSSSKPKTIDITHSGDYTVNIPGHGAGQLLLSRHIDSTGEVVISRVIIDSIEVSEITQVTAPIINTSSTNCLGKKAHVEKFIKFSLDQCERVVDDEGEVVAFIKRHDNAKINVFVGYYCDADNKRNAELEYCYAQNINNPYINTFLLKQDKRPLFSEYRDAIRKYSDKNSVNIIINSDIYFDRTVLLAETVPNNYVYTLNRWNKTGNNIVHYNPAHCTNDCWIFRGSLDNVDLKFYVGQPGCDVAFVSELSKAKYKLFNPSFSIRAIHMHESGIRRYPSREYFGGCVHARPCLIENIPGKVAIRKVLKHCHFSILYNELPFLKQKLPFLYDHFDQIIFYDLNIKTFKFSDDGSHEFIKNYPDPLNKITLIEKTNLSDVTNFKGNSFIEKQKMFAVGSSFVKDDIDVFWCTDMDEFFSASLIKKVELQFILEAAKSILVPHFIFFKDTEHLICRNEFKIKNKSIEYQLLPWSRITVHKKGNIYGHCSLQEQFLPSKIVDDMIYHFAYIGDQRVRFKCSLYNKQFLTDVWRKSSSKITNLRSLSAHYVIKNKKVIIPDYINVAELLIDLK